MTGLAGRLARIDAPGVDGFAFETEGAGLAVAVDGADVETSGSGGFDPRDAAAVWQGFARDGRLRDAGTGGRGGSAAAVAARVRIEPGETRTIRFAIAWDLPIVRFGDGRSWYKRYTREWGTGGRRAVELAAHALRSTPEWRTAIEAWQAPTLAATDRPDWYKAALFNELYYLVDGGTLWPDRPVEDGAGHPGDGRDRGPRVLRLRLLQHPRRPLLRGVGASPPVACASGVDQPGLREDRGDRRPRGRHDPGERRTGDPRSCAGALPHDLGGPAEDPFARRQPLRLSGRERLEGPEPEVRPPGVARSAPRPRPGWLRPRRLAIDRDGNGLRCGVRPRWRRPPRARWGAGPDLRHLADDRAERLRRQPLAGRAPGRRRIRPAWPGTRRERRPGTPTSIGPGPASRHASGTAAPTTTTRAAARRRTA